MGVTVAMAQLPFYPQPLTFPSTCRARGGWGMLRDPVSEGGCSVARAALQTVRPRDTLKPNVRPQIAPSSDEMPSPVLLCHVM